ncbi:MAG: CdaR family protein [Candidatus Berkelbacteria bacterium]
MFDHFKKNLLIKILCLVGATLLWGYVASSQSMVANFPGNLTIETINVPSGLTPILGSKTVEIKIMAKQGIWQKLAPSNFSAYVDLKGLKEGTNEIDVIVTSKQSTVSVISKSPEKIMVTLEKTISKEVPLKGKIDGNLAEGMIVDKIALNPNTVTVTGSKQVLDTILEITVPVKADGEAASFVKKAAVALDSNAGSNAILDPVETEATVTLAKGANIKTVGITADTSGVVRTNYYISGIQVTPDTIDISGPKDVIDKIKVLETQPISVSDLAADTATDVGLVLPSGVTLYNAANTKVHVTVQISLAEAFREFDVTLFQFLGSSLYTYTPTSVKIRVRGPLSAINALTGADFSVLVNPETRPSVNGDITYSLAPVDIKAPADVIVTSVTPTQIVFRAK